MNYWNERAVALKNRAEKGELTGDDLNEFVLTFFGIKIETENDLEKIKKQIGTTITTVRGIEEEYPLLPTEADDLAIAVKRKGVEVMGGKKSNAYKNTDLRKRVFMDIYGEVKRQYGLISETGRQLSYKKLKRKYFKGALVVADTYVAPVTLQNDIDAENELEGMDD